MKKIRVVKLGTICIDKASETKGMLTHWVYDMDGKLFYLFQPRGLDELGEPVKKLFLGLARLDVRPNDFEDVDIPVEVLGSTVTDDASGFTGMAIEFTRHINGCFHVGIQPKGFNLKTNATVRPHDFDLRSCSGEMITKMNEEELAKSKIEAPSPSDDSYERLPYSDDLSEIRELS